MSNNPIQKDLEVLEEILQNRSVSKEYEDLQEVVHSLQANKPIPQAKYLHQLDQQVEHQLHSKGILSKLKLPSLKVMAPVLATLLIVAFVGGSVLHSQNTFQSTSPGKGSEAAADRQIDPSSLEQEKLRPEPFAGGVNDTSGSSEPSAAIPPSPLPQPFSPSSDRKVESQATIVLSTQENNFQVVTDKLIRLTGSNGGYILDSNIQRSEAYAIAHISVQVPNDQLQTFLSKVTKVSHVVSINQSTHDITSQFDEVKERISDLRAERESLRRQLSKTILSENQRRDIKNELDRLRQELAQQYKTRASLNTRVVFSHVQITVEKESNRDYSDTPASEGWGIDDAWSDAQSVLNKMGAVALFLVLLLFPLIMLGLVIYMLLKVYKRKQKKRVLDQL